MLLLGALVALGLGLYLTGQVYAQSPGSTPGAAPAAKPARTDPPRVAVFNVVKVMKDFQKWQYFAITMNNKRITAAGELGKLRNEIVELTQKAEKEPRKDVQDELARAIVGKQRTFEDSEKLYGKSLNEESATHLKALYVEIQRAVASIVETNGYDLVFAYPDGTTVEELASPTVIDMKIRPQFAMPFFVAKSADMTESLTITLNKYFPPPGAIPAAMTAPVAGPVVPTAGQR